MTREPRHLHQEEEPDSTPHSQKNAKIYLGRKSHETLCEHLIAFDLSSTFWVRGRNNHRFAFRSNVKSNFKSTTGCERRKQLAIQHDVHGPGDASPYDCREYQCVRQFGKRRRACQRFELF
jgi:hypothetical protein